jgi:hypothetical protein
MTTIKCHVTGCDNQATCIGKYETMEEPEFACSECCGHGNEDGRCIPIEIKVKMPAKDINTCKIILTF